MTEHLYKVTFKYYGEVKTEEAWAFSGHDAIIALKGDYWLFGSEGSEVFEVVSVEVLV